MSILISPAALAVRADVARGPLQSLAASLAADLERLAASDIYFPRDKALLSRDGGRCARDGTLLDFDPFERHAHRCPKCGEVYHGAHHDRFWIYWYQMWLAERAVHAAALAAVGDDRFVPLARGILDGYAERYTSYPNIDNVLGPSRLFFSTYLESIWLLQICIAADLLDGRDARPADRVRDRIVEPARAIVAGYDEGGSNRQVWNDAALLASSRLLGDSATAEQAVFGASGVAAQLAGGLLSDGTWYEGENYHLFAHRGLWYGVTMAEHAGMELPPALVDRFQRGFATPFATALPDLTLPARRDSQYAISLRQWRIAEHCELGLARRDDPVLAGGLARLYGDPIPRRPTGRDRSSADVERNMPATALSRADLSWRALLFAPPELPTGLAGPPRSALLDAQGIAVFRRDDAHVYVALDYGHSGGGHGHPDRLNLLLAVDEQRWLDDFGTGSYVDPSLHWYRSTLAHNAPLVDGRSQDRVDGALLAFDEHGDAGWIVAAANVAPGVSVQRTLVVLPGYAIDSVTWQADREVTIDLPLHVALPLDSDSPHAAPAALEGGSGTEDGFAFVRDAVLGAVADAGAVVRGSARAGERTLRTVTRASANAEWWSAAAPGAPGAGTKTFRVVRMRGDAGELRTVWMWNDAALDAELHDDETVVRLDGGIEHRHRPLDDGWAIDVTGAGVPRTVRLAGLIDELDESPEVRVPIARDPIIVPASGKPISMELGERSYRRSEQSWTEAGSPTARVSLARTDAGLEVTVEGQPSDRTFAPADAVNPYDNEPADINGDGVELFVADGGKLSGWMLVPELRSDRVRVRAIEGWTTERPIVAQWQATAIGYRLIATLSGPPPDAIDVIVNEMPRGRERRRGQLVLSGGAGEFVYLRGDRHDAVRLIPLRFTHA